MAGASLASLDRRFDLATIIRALPVVFLIHDAEEVQTAEQFLRENRTRLPLPPAMVRHLEVTRSQFAAAVVPLLAAISAVSYAAERSLKPGVAMQLFTFAVSSLFLNVFTHLGQGLILRRYTPGVVSAVALVLPYSLYTLRRLTLEKMVSRQDLSMSMLASALLLVPLALSAQALGRLATRRC